ncbi:AI-2E family transporter [Chitinimonas koreensis]|uniref:AI-2E family transporter n=1 Tax=Chitinimonas koreensis TaxID=356302 RepID=UPI000406E555|nr:hypothetical protein [Chitinimonas koreensis]QNM95324.1 hypothetical protein H9L41_15800 [Chitinimonas koreensis]
MTPNRYDWITLAAVLLGWLLVLHLGAAAALLAGLASYTFTRGLIDPARLGRLRLGRAGVALLFALLPLMLVWAASAFLGHHLSSLGDETAGLWQRLLLQAVELRAQLPQVLAEAIPASPAELEHRLLALLSSRGEQLMAAGRHSLGLVLVTLFGWWLGLAAALATPAEPAGPLLAAWRRRWAGLAMVFGRLARGQCWVALINSLFTAIFLFLIAPLADWHFPFRSALILITFVVSLVPVAGNLVCNTLLLLIGLGVSLPAGIGALVFLVVVHKLEYLVSARVLGTANRLSAWELITAMLAGELLFGPVGLVCAAVLYPYIKHELRQAKLI